MFDFIPVENYTIYYYNFLLVFVIGFWLSAQQSGVTSKNNLLSKKIFGGVLLVLLIAYMGLRPIDGRYFGDMGAYATYFKSYQRGSVKIFDQDIGFDQFMQLCSKFLSVEQFFLVSSTLYILPLYLASQKWFKNLWPYSFLMLVASLSFWNYGVNGMRNGIATSMLLLGLSYADRKVIGFIICLIAVSFHKSVLLPVLAYIFAYFYNDTKKVLYFWLLCIPISILSGGFFDGLFANIGFSDTRFSGYLTADSDMQFGTGAFRWDFLVYSAIPVVSGWYFIVKREYQDVVYQRLFTMYLIANGFWILVIRASYSNRFAYLSWFAIAIVTIYPVLKRRFFKNHHKMVVAIVLFYFLITYFLNMILAK